MNTQDKLDKLTELYAESDMVHARYAELRNEIVPAEIAAKLDDLAAEEKGATAAIEEVIAALTDEIKAEVIAAGATVRGQYAQAIYTKGRVSWDTKALDGYAAGHPEIAPFRKIGAPSVSIRWSVES